MRLDNAKVQSGSNASLVMPRVCVCQPSSNEPSRGTQSGALCSVCGGSRPQPPEAPRPERQERRKLEDFLGGFV